MFGGSTEQLAPQSLVLSVSLCGVKFTRVPFHGLGPFFQIQTSRYQGLEEIIGVKRG